jgi:hypothetical protein
MSLVTLRKLTAASLVVALAATFTPAFAVPATATLTGTVFGENVSAPLAGATVVVTDANGTKLASQPTGANGSFTVTGVPPGTQTLALETKDGAFAIATPITLAPGETKGVQLALKAASDQDDKKKKKGAAAPPSAAAKGAMIATIIGFAVLGALAVDSLGNDNKSNASPSQPAPTDK